MNLGKALSIGTIIASFTINSLYAKDVYSQVDETKEKTYEVIQGNDWYTLTFIPKSAIRVAGKYNGNREYYILPKSEEAPGAYLNNRTDLEGKLRAMDGDSSWKMVENNFGLFDGPEVAARIKRIAELQPDSKLRKQLLIDVNNDGIVGDVLNEGDMVYIPSLLEIYTIRFKKGDCFIDTYNKNIDRSQYKGAISTEHNITFILKKDNEKGEGGDRMPSEYGKVYCSYVGEKGENLESTLRRVLKVSEGANMAEIMKEVIQTEYNFKSRDILEDPAPFKENIDIVIPRFY